MPREELKDEIAHGVRFWGFEQDGELLGVMGLQDVEDVTLIRHAYVRTSHHRRGIGGRLLHELRSKATRPLLVVIWAAAEWAIKFYRQRGFEMVRPDKCPPCCVVTGPSPSARSRSPSCWQRKPGSIEADLASDPHENRCSSHRDGGRPSCSRRRPQSPPWPRLVAHARPHSKLLQTACLLLRSRSGVPTDQHLPAWRNNRRRKSLPLQSRQAPVPRQDRIGGRRRRQTCLVLC